MGGNDYNEQGNKKPGGKKNHILIEIFMKD